MLTKKKFSRQKLVINSFFRQLFLKLLTWLSLGVILSFLGGFWGNKDYISQDILGIIYKNTVNSEGKSFQRFFLGDNLVDKKKLLFYALFSIGIVVFLNIIVSLVNLAFCLRDKYIENNEFYLYDPWVFFLNTILRIATYIIITFSLVSAQTMLLVLTFFILSSWLWNKKVKNLPRSENFLVWQDNYAWKILFYSSVIIILLPFIYAKAERIFKKISEEGSSGSISKVQGLLTNLVNSIPLLRIVWELVLNASNFAHWIILFWFIRSVIFDRISEFNKFWAKINNITKQATDFKQFYNYQNLLSKANITSKKVDIPTQTKRVIILGDYGFFQITPNFLKKEYLEKELGDHEREIFLKEFSEKIKKVIDFIDFLPEKINPSKASEHRRKEVNFLTYCLFNEYKSYEEVEQTKQLILVS